MGQPGLHLTDEIQGLSGPALSLEMVLPGQSLCDEIARDPGQEA